MDLTFQVPMQYWTLQHQTLLLPVFSPWLSVFILSGAISPLLSSSILDIHRPGEFIFQCHIFLPFHTAKGPQGQNTELVFLPFSSWPLFVRSLHHDPSILPGPILHGLLFHWVRQGSNLWWSVWLVFCDYGFHSVCSLMDEDKRLMEASWWEGLTVENTGSCSGGQGHAW